MKMRIDDLASKLSKYALLTALALPGCNESIEDQNKDPVLEIIVMSMPSNSPRYSGITLIDTTTGKIQCFANSSLTGKFSQQITKGTYYINIAAIGCYNHSDTITVTKDTTLNIRVLEAMPKDSKYEPVVII